MHSSFFLNFACMLSPCRGITDLQVDPCSPPLFSSYADWPMRAFCFICFVPGRESVHLILVVSLPSLLVFYWSINMCLFLLVGPRIVAFVPFLALSACFYFLSLVLGMLNLPV